jgi:hypothetical protein
MTKLKNGRQGGQPLTGKVDQAAEIGIFPCKAETQEKERSFALKS